MSTPENVNLFLDILINLNRKDFKKVRRLAKKTKVYHEIVGCDCIESITFKDRVKDCDGVVTYYYLVYYYDKTLRYFQLLTPRKDANLFNTIPSILIQYGISETDFQTEIKIPHKKCKGKQTIILLQDFLGVEGEEVDFVVMLARASLLFGVDFDIYHVTSSTVYKETERLLNQGYRYFIAPSYSSNLSIILPLIQAHKEALFVSPLATNNDLISASNLVKFALTDNYFARILNSFVASAPMLVIAESNATSQHIADQIVLYIPGSIKRTIDSDYRNQTLLAIQAAPNVTNVFFAQTDNIQAFLTAVGSDTFPTGYIFYASDAFQVLKLVWSSNIISINPSYANTNMRLVAFDSPNYFDYAYADAIYWLQQYINVGYRSLGSINGVVELDTDGNRYWYMFALMTYDAVTNLWSQAGTLLLDTVWSSNVLTIKR